MFKKLTQNAISNIKEPYAQLTVIGLITVFSILIYRNNQYLAYYKDKIEKGEMHGEVQDNRIIRYQDKIDSLINENGLLRVENAKVIAQSKIEISNLIVNFNNMQNKLKQKLRK